MHTPRPWKMTAVYRIKNWLWRLTHNYMYCICGERIPKTESACPKCYEDMDRLADLFDDRNRF